METTKSSINPDHRTQARPSTNGSALIQTTAISARLLIRVTIIVHRRRAMDRSTQMVSIIIRTGVTWNSPKPYCERRCSATVNYTTRQTGLGALLPGQGETESITVTTVKTELLQARDRAIRRGSVSLATEL